MQRTLTLALLCKLLLYSTLPSYGSTTILQHEEPSIAGTRVGQNTTVSRLSSRPLAFTENHGQWDDKVRFRTHAVGATMWFTTSGVYYQFTRCIPHDNSGSPGPANPEHDRRQRESEVIEQLVITASLVGAKPSLQIVGNDLMEYRCNYFIGNDPGKWHTDVPNYNTVVYEEVYAGIDLKYYGNGKHMEYDFIVSPGADPNQIMVQYEGAKSISVNEHGELVVETDWGTITELRPSVFQVDAFGPILTDANYLLLSHNTFGFELGNTFNPELALIIDPVLSYSTYLGGSDEDESYDIATDSEGNAYITGHTKSLDFPIEGAFCDTLSGSEGDSDVFVTKLNSVGSELIYSTYIGGTGIDRCEGIAVDTNGCVHIVGVTGSTDFPTENAYQSSLKGVADIFVVRLSSDGDSLTFGTYFGGKASDQGHSISLDNQGNAYIAGSTWSSDFPTENAYESEAPGGNGDGVVAKLHIPTNSLIYSTYLGGDDFDRLSGLDVDAEGCAYVSGSTRSVDFPTVNAFQSAHQGQMDMFLSKISSDGDSLCYSTFIGGSGTDDGWGGVAIDGSGNAHACGMTSSTDFPTTDGALQTDFNGQYTDGFVVKLNSSGDGLIYGTYLGGSEPDYNSDCCYSVVIDESGRAYVCGYTSSTDFPTVDADQAELAGVSDAFVSRLSLDGSELTYSTFLGGATGSEHYSSLTMDVDGNVYISGITLANDYPTTVGAYQTSMGGGISDAFVAKFSASDPPHDCGDANASGDIDIDDIMYLIAYMFTGGPEPNPYDSGDSNCSGFVDIDDIMYLIDYMFTGGPDPCDIDNDGEPDC